MNGELKIIVSYNYVMLIKRGWGKIMNKKTKIITIAAVSGGGKLLLQKD